MSYYLLQWRFKDEQIKAMVDRPHDRTAEARKAIEAHGGTLHHYFFAFGDYDGIALVEFPHNEACVSSLMTIVGAGGLVALKTTVLITAEEARSAMQGAGSITSGYEPPVGYSGMRPGDEAPAGTPGAGEDICPVCAGTGNKDGQPCPNCAGTGTITKGIGGA